jgi:hypothetical protein
MSNARTLQVRWLVVRFGTLAAILALLWSGSAVSQNWQSLDLPGDVFTIEMPGPPKYEERKVKSDAGTEFPMHHYVVETTNGSYVAEIASYPNDVDVSNPRSTLQAGADNAAYVIEGSKWDSVTWVQHQGLDAFDAFGHRKGFEVRLYSIMKSRLALVLCYTGATDTSRSADVERFIASVRVRN